MTTGLDERKALPRELRLTIDLDREVENSLPLLLGADFVAQMDLLGQL